MDMRARQAVIAELLGAYRAAGRKQRGLLLDHICAVTGYRRKYAIGLLRGAPRKAPRQRRRAARYGTAVRHVVRTVWEASGWICADRLKPVLLELATHLERHGSVDLDEKLRADLAAISVSTLKRMMSRLEIDIARRRQMTTRPGSLRSEIPLAVGVRSDVPGLIEIDLVAHCGASGAGDFVYTLCATDLASGWTERVAILGKSRHTVVSALQRVQSQLPFALHALHSDNGSEFLNDAVLRWCRSEGIAFTRGRPYHKNDNAHVEERNWTLVRKLIGYARLDTEQQCSWLNALYTDLLRIHNNGFQPIMKLIAKERVDGRVRRRYDLAATPAQRVLHAAPSPAIAKFLTHVREVNPLQLKRRIDRTIAAMPNTVGAESA